MIAFLTFLQVYNLTDLSKPVYVAEALTSTPPFLSANFTGRRAAAKEVLTEILVADLGDAVAKTPYLIVSIPGYHSMPITNFMRLASSRYR